MTIYKHLLVVGFILLTLQGCKDTAKKIFGFDDQFPVKELVAYKVLLNNKDVIKEQTAWTIQADIKQTTANAAELQVFWGIIDAPVGFDMPLSFTQVSEQGQALLNFVTPDVDEDTQVTLQMSVSFDNGRELETISKEVDLLIQVNKQLIISGSVTDEPIPNALVTVVIGHLEFQTTADNQGNYTLEVEFPEDDLMVVVTAEGSDDFDSVLFKSYLGDGESLLSSAGIDGVLTADENNNLTVSNVTTAKYVIINNQLVEDEGLLNQAKLDDVNKQLDFNDVLVIAALIKAVVDNNVELPEGITNTLQLVQDKQLTAQFIADISSENPDVINELINDIIYDPTLTPADPRFSFTNKFYLVKSDEYQSAISDVFDIKDDGEGSWSTSSGTFVITWTLTDGILSIAAQDDEGAFIETYCTSENNITSCYDKYYSSAKVKKLPTSDSVVQLYVDYSYKMVNTDSSEVTYLQQFNTFNALSDKDVIPFDDKELMDSQWVISVLDESVDNSNLMFAALPIESVYATFKDDGTGFYHQLIDGGEVQFNWAITFGILAIEVVADDNPTVNSTNHLMTYAQINNLQGVRQTNLLINAPELVNVNPKMKTSTSGMLTTVSLRGDMAAVNVAFDVNSFELDGQYGLLTKAYQSPTEFLEFSTDKFGEQYRHIDSKTVEVLPFEWNETELGIITKSYYSEADDANVSNCDDIEGTCYMTQQRDVEIVDKAGNIYTIRSLVTDFIFKEGLTQVEGRSSNIALLEYFHNSELNN